jgi:hypothetical protein
MLITAPYYTHSFGAMGETLDSARRTEFFQWFHLEETERHAERPGGVVRFRPSGEAFRDHCYLDVLTAGISKMILLELVVARSFLDGSNHLFAQDLVKSFLFGSLPDACRSVLSNFLQEMNVPGDEGKTPGYNVFRGRQNEWQAETGWSRLALANLNPAQIPSLVVHVGANPTAPNAQLIES